MHHFLSDTLGKGMEWHSNKEWKGCIGQKKVENYWSNTLLKSGGKLIGRQFKESDSSPEFLKTGTAEECTKIGKGASQDK